MPFNDIAELLANTDIVLSICPPHGAPKEYVSQDTLLFLRLIPE
jgi:hypothetical protein